MDKTTQYRLGLVLVTASAVAWSMTGFFTRAVEADTWSMLAWRGLFGSLGLAVAIPLIEPRRNWPLLWRLGPAGWMFALVSAAGMIFFVTSLRHTTVAHVSVIYATVPFVAAALDWLVSRERPGRSALAASAGALAGVAVMVGLGTDGHWLGDLLAVAMTVCMALMMIIAKRYRGIPGLSAACLSSLLSGLACWPLGDPMAVSGHDVVLLLLSGVVNSALGLALFMLGARFLPAIETALIGALDAPLAPLWVWLAFGETPGTPTLVGGAVVFAAVGVHLSLAMGRRKG